MYTNAYTLSTPTFDPIGVALDPIIGRANHSCDPNAFIAFDQPQVSVRALKAISKDEEVLVSYIDTSIPFDYRQAQLLDMFHFRCQCVKCRRGSGQIEDDFL